MDRATTLCLIRHIYLTSRQPTTTCSSSILTTFCRENYSITSMRQKIVSKSSSNPEAWIFMLQAKNVLIVMVPILINKDVFSGSDSKVSVCNAGDPGSIPGLGRSPGEGNGSSLQYSCLENPMDCGA